METRRSPRVKINFKVVSTIDEKVKQKFSLSIGKTFEARAVDISTLGIGIMAQYFFPRGINIEMEIDGKVFGLDRAIIVKGEIRYSKYMSSSEYRTGIKFLNLSPDDAKAIADFIAVAEKRKAPRFKVE